MCGKYAAKALFGVKKFEQAKYSAGQNH